MLKVFDLNYFLIGQIICNSSILSSQYIQYMFISKYFVADIVFSKFDNHRKRTTTAIIRSSHRICYVRKGVLRNFAKLTGKHLYQSLFFNKIAGLRLHLYRTALGDCFSMFRLKSWDLSKTLFLNTSHFLKNSSVFSFFIFIKFMSTIRQFFLKHFHEDLSIVSNFPFKAITTFFKKSEVSLFISFLSASISSSFSKLIGKCIFHVSSTY